MMADLACEWQAGHDRYTGTVAAAIASYGFPIATQSALIAAWERREFIDTVVIDRDAIIGKNHDYAPEIRSMHFGDRGRVCETVSRAGWSDDHIETAIVVCADDECIAVPAVCTNVSRITRSGTSRAAAGPAADPLSADLVAVLPPPVSETIADPQSPLSAVPGKFYAGPSGSEWSAFTPPSGFWTATNPPRPLAPIPVSPVPEPQRWQLLGLGLTALLAARHFHRKPT